jgi:hypothetical protein
MSDTGGSQRPLNPIQRLLDERHIPWRESQSDLIARYGISPDPWWGGPSIVAVELSPPPLPGLLRPIQFAPRANCDPALPPLQFAGWSWADRGKWFGSHAVASLEMVAESLAPMLGQGAAYDTSNTRGLRWRFGAASVEAICFPRRLSPGSGSNPATRADPRFPDSCWVELHSGFRPPCSAEERDAIEAFDAAFVLSESGDPEFIAGNPPLQHLLDYVREPFAGSERVAGRIGRSGDLLVFATDQLYVVPLAQVVHVEALRAAPARGRGYAKLRLACRGDFGERPVRDIVLADHDEPDGLDDLAGRLAAWLDRPCRFRDCLDD